MREVIKFYATWCQPCKALSENLKGVHVDVKIQEVDIDENMELAQKHFVRSVPTMIMLENGEVVKRFSGVKTPDQLEAWFNG